MEITYIRSKMRKDSYLEMSLHCPEEEMRASNGPGIPQIHICLFNFKEESILFQMKKEFVLRMVNGLIKLILWETRDIVICGEDAIQIKIVSSKKGMWIPIQDCPCDSSASATISSRSIWITLKWSLGWKVKASQNVF